MRSAREVLQARLNRGARQGNVRRMRSAFVPAAFACALAACASSPSSTPTPASEESPFCALRRLVCERQVACGTYLLTRATSVESCMAQLACGAQERAAAVSGVRLDEEKIQACAEALRGASCEALTPFEGDMPSTVLATNAACAGVVSGTRRAGEACVLGVQCADGLECAGGTCPGTCRAKAPACNPGVCPAGTYCADTACKPQAKLGASCSFCSGDDASCNSCEIGLFCQMRAGEFSGTCVAAKPTGAACSDSSSFNECAAPNVCLSEGSVCAAPVPLGQPCAGALDCGREARCDFNGTHACAPLLPMGAACTNVYFECGPGAACVDGVCTRGGAGPTKGAVEVRPTVGAGGDCFRANCGPNLACRPHGDAQRPTWTCDPLVPVGGVCEPESESFKVLLMLAGVRAVSPCEEGVCDLFSTPWRCVTQKQPGEACSRPSLDLACASGVCSNARCADFYACR